MTETDKLKAEIEALKAQNTALQAKANKPAGRISYKVSEKGALSVYGLGRFPVTLYREQWERLLGAGEDIKMFIAKNTMALKLKGEEQAKPEAAPPAAPATMVRKAS